MEDTRSILLAEVVLAGTFSELEMDRHCRLPDCREALDPALPHFHFPGECVVRRLIPQQAPKRPAIAVRRDRGRPAFRVPLPLLSHRFGYLLQDIKPTQQQRQMRYDLPNVKQMQSSVQGGRSVTVVSISQSDLDSDAMSGGHATASQPVHWPTDEFVQKE